MLTLTGVWKKVIPILMDDFEGFKPSMNEVTAMWWKQQEN